MTNYMTYFCFTFSRTDLKATIFFLQLILHDEIYIFVCNIQHQIKHHISTHLVHIVYASHVSLLTSGVIIRRNLRIEAPDWNNKENAKKQYINS